MQKQKNSLLNWVFHFLIHNPVNDASLSRIDIIKQLFWKTIFVPYDMKTTAEYAERWFDTILSL